MDTKCDRDSEEDAALPVMPIDEDDDQDQSQQDAPRGPDDDGTGPIAPVVDADAGIDAEEEAQQPIGFRDPGVPTAAQIAEHNLTHIPARPWCTHCVRGKGKDKHSRRLHGAFAEDHVPRVRLDYCFLTETLDETEGEHGEEESTRASSSMTVLVMQESQCRSVWAYSVEHKGSSEAWVIDQIAEDLDTVGLRNDRIIIKSDQEASANDIANEVSKCRASTYGTAIENSAVGDSNSNGTVERAIQDVEAQCRAMRSALEERLAVPVKLDSPVVPWLVRHAAILITRCRVRPSGRTSFELMKGRRSNGRLAEFGEIMHFKIPHTKLNPGKFEDQWSEGVWLGVDLRSGENYIGTNVGVFRVATVRRVPEDERWSAARIASIAGCPRQPVPGQASRRSPAYSKKFEITKPTDESFVPQPPVEGRVRTWKIYKHDIEEHGATEGCAGCRAVMRGATYKAGHTAACRLRMQDLIMSDDAGRARVERAHERRGDALAPPVGQQQGGGEASATAAPSNSREPRREDVEGQGEAAPLPPPRLQPTARLPTPAPASGEDYQDRLRRTRAGKRAADEAPDDPRATGTDEPEVIRPPDPEGFATGFRRMQGVGGDQERGHKRRAESAPDDPRLVAGGAEAEVVTDRPAGSLRPADSIGHHRECGSCGECFRSRNALHKHLKHAGHQVIDEEDSPPGLMVDSSDDEDSSHRPLADSSDDDSDDSDAPVRAPFSQRGTMPGGKVEGGRELKDVDASQRGTMPGEKSKAHDIRQRILDHFGGKCAPGIGVDVPVNSLSSHPGPRLNADDIKARDLQWTDIGSGIMSRTFI